MIPLLCWEVEPWSRFRDIFTLCKARPRARTCSCTSEDFAWTRGCVLLTYSTILDDFPLCSLNIAEEQVSLFPYTAVYIYKVLHKHKYISIHTIFVFPDISYALYLLNADPEPRSWTPDCAKPEKIPRIIVLCTPRSGVFSQSQSFGGTCTFARLSFGFW